MWQEAEQKHQEPAVILLLGSLRAMRQIVVHCGGSDMMCTQDYGVSIF